MDLFKKIILTLAIPFVFESCVVYPELSNSRTISQRGSNSLYQRIRSMNDLTGLTDFELMDYWSMKFRNSTYSSFLGKDSDGDGIINADDIWDYQYGPYVDLNGNGVVDIFDMQVAGFGNYYIDNYPFELRQRWLGLNLNPFWYREYSNRYIRYYRIHREHRHQDKRYTLSTKVRNNRNSNTNTKVRTTSERRIRKTTVPTNRRTISRERKENKQPPRNENSRRNFSRKKSTLQKSKIRKR